MSDLERRLADALKGVGDRHLDEAPHRPGAVQRLVVQRVRRRWGIVVVGTTAGIALVLVLAAVSVPRLVSDRGGASNDVAHAALVPVTTTIEIGKNPVAIAADDQAVWVALRNGFLQRIDAASNADISGIEVASRFTDVAVGAGQVWAAGKSSGSQDLVGNPPSDNALFSVDPSGQGYAVHPVEEAQLSLAITPESVWAISEEANPEGGTLNRLTFDAGGRDQAGVSGWESTQWVPEGIVADGESIWTVGGDAGYVVRQLDGVTGDVREEVKQEELFATCPSPCNRSITSPIAVGDGSVVATWWTRPSPIAQLDQRTGAVLQTGYEIEGLGNMFGATRAVAISAGEAWVIVEGDRVARMDLESGELIGEPIEVGSEPVDIAAGAGAVWTINRGDGTVTRIDLVEPAPGPAPEQTPASPEAPAPTPTPPPSPTPDPDDPAQALDVDAQMTELIERAKATCDNFDFQFKEEIDGRLYRPAYCNDGIKRTILLFSFATEEDREAWADAGRPSEFSLAKRPSIVVGRTWEAHVIGADLARQIGEKLDGEVIRWTED